MKDLTKETIERYDIRLKKFGYNPKTLGWINGRQGIRFSVLSQIGSLNNTKILDIGCGFGDFYGFLQYKKIKCKYLGLDINSNLLKIAKKKYPKGKFSEFDLETDEIPKYDWIIMSGVFNFKRNNPYTHIEKNLKKLFLACKKGIAIDFMSSYVDHKNKNLNHISPEKILKIAKTISASVSIRHDYMPYEFCLYIYKFSKTDDNTFKEFKFSIPKELRTNKWLKK